MKTISQEAFLASLPASPEGSKKSVEHQSVFHRISEPIDNYCNVYDLNLTKSIQVSKGVDNLSVTEKLELQKDDVTKHHLVPANRIQWKRAIVSYRISEPNIEKPIDFMILYIMDLERNRLSIAHGSQVTVCSNGNIMGAISVISQNAAKNWGNIDNACTAWLASRELTMNKQTAFMENLQLIEVQGQAYHDVWSKMMHNAVLTKTKFGIQTDLINAALRYANKPEYAFETKYMEDLNPSSNLWNIYNCYTETLKTEPEMINRATKHTKVSAFFASLANEIQGEDVFDLKEFA